MIRHHDEGIQRDLVSEFAGSLPFFGHDFPEVTEIHPSAFDTAEERSALLRVRRDEVGAAAVVVRVASSGASAERTVEESFHGVRRDGEEERLYPTDT